MSEPTELETYRAAKDAFFRDEPESPLPASQRRTFRGLTYYAEAPALVFEVTPEPYDDPEIVEFGGDTREYQRWARIRFAVDGVEQSLTVFRQPYSGELFLPFVDAGAWSETYGAGRYLDLPVLEGGRLLVDFNYAYHPYCAYNPGYSCPIPPAENRLPVSIRAGERLDPDEGAHA
ncbi:MAG: DUF1684 domain-containing protein [Chloroflexi bacterium]|nr:DUF1684 domain-containing protein [Chloroflexota bacterium]